MARRGTSVAEDLMVILSRLPWWLSLLLGLASWLLLRQVANTPALSPALMKPGDMSGLVLGQLWRTFAAVGQYVLPLICVFGAIGSILGRRQRKRRLSDVNAASQPARVIDGLTWQQFEQLIGEAFRQRGYSVIETGGQGADGGIDLILCNGSEKYLVQCKHWRALKVGVAVIREFFGAMAAEGAAGGFVVTSGQFTADAKSFAAGRNVQLIDGSQLKLLLVQAGRAGASRALPETTVAPQEHTEVLCPRCSSSMIKRIAKRGANAGNAFWGCSAYPDCKQIVNLSDT